MNPGLLENDAGIQGYKLGSQLMSTKFGVVFDCESHPSNSTTCVCAIYEPIQ